MPTHVRTRVEGNIGWLELDGADRLNAIGSTTHSDLVSAIHELENQHPVRAVVIHGGGRAFSAGADIAEMQEFTSREEFADFIHGFTELRQKRVEKVTVGC